MGASGAGKTTLLNVLNFRNTSSLKISGNMQDCTKNADWTLIFSKIVGQRCLNGVPVGPDALTSLSAYIQQDDLFFGTLTVREHLVFQARVRMDAHIPYKTRMKRVDEVIQEVPILLLIIQSRVELNKLNNFVRLPHSLGCQNAKRRPLGSLAA